MGFTTGRLQPGDAFLWRKPDEPYLGFKVVRTNNDHNDHNSFIYKEYVLATVNEIGVGIIIMALFSIAKMLSN